MTGLAETAAVGAGVLLAVSAATSATRHRRTAERLRFLRRVSTDRLGGAHPGPARGGQDAVTTGPGVPDWTAGLLGDLRRALRAGRAEITVADDGGWRRISLAGLQAHPRAASETGPPPELALLRHGRLHVARLGAGTQLRTSLAERLGPEGLLVPLRDGPDLIGFLGVGEPRRRGSFGREDLMLLDAVAGRVASELGRHRLARRSRYYATHDRLTGLLNRACFVELLGRSPSLRTVLVVDLDHLREVNDTAGPSIGDRLLRQAAERVAAEVGHPGVLARLGGDELGVAVPLGAPFAGAALAARLTRRLALPFDLDEARVALTATVGVAVDGSTRTDPVRLLVRAETALFGAKAEHRSWRIHSTGSNQPDRDRLALAAELRAAIDEGELEVHYQPKIDLRSGAVFGFEALVRWRHPGRGLLGPDAFVPLAEDTGLIGPLTMWVIEDATRNHRELRRAGFDGLELAVNLSLRSMVDLDFADRVGKLLRANGMPPSLLTLEVTESTVMSDPDRTVRMLERLAELGTTISVDDFGTGYASLSHLRRLPAGELKIDQSFVAGMLDAPRDATIVASTIDLARKLGLRAVAEGVEDADTLAALGELGCDQAQGYFVSRPLPADQLREWLSDRSTTSLPRDHRGGADRRPPTAPPSPRPAPLRQAPAPPRESARLRSGNPRD